MSKRYPGGIIRKTPPTPSQTSAQGIWDMASVTQAVKENTWPIAGVPDPISRSLRFRSSASAYLNRTPASVGNRKTWTFSTWIKLGEIAASNGTIFAAGTTSGVSTRFYLRYTGSQFQTGYGSFNLDTTVAVYRDPSAWYHVVLAIDTTQATAANRLKIYVNGVQQTVTTSVNYSQNDDTAVNNSVTHSIARDHIIPGGYFDGYLTETYLIDGQALTPSSFGSTNDQTGVWQPIAYTGTYGTNGFYLPFSNTASTTTLGYDFSGNSNNWTPNNISLTSGSTYDSMVDVPTQWIPYNTAGDTGALFRGNYATFNPTIGPSASGWYAPTFSNGNLNYSTSMSLNAAGGNYNLSTMQTTSGKWYAEFTIGTRSGIPVAGNDDFGVVVGIAPTDNNYSPSIGVVYKATNGQVRIDGAGGTSYGNSYTTGDVIGVALDMDNGKVWFSKNGTWQNSGDPVAGTNPAASSRTGLYGIGLQVNTFANAGAYTTAASANYGQQPFSYTPPAGFKTLCTTNLSTPTIGATASSQANDYFNAVTYTGTGATQSITGLDFQPDFVWIKSRNNAGSNHLIDAVRGIPLFLFSDSTAADTSRPNSFTSFNSNGFTVGSSSDGNTNLNTYTYVAWNWKANGSGSTNTAGSITSTVSVNTTAGFSIVTFTAPSGSTAYTVGHGLGTTPAMIIVKERGAAGNDWYVWHQSFSNTAQGNLRLNTTAAVGNSSQVWNNTAPTSTVFSSIAGTAVASSTTAVAYCFAQVAGYSAFGSYTGNGSSDGPFIFTGFRPRWLLVKASTTSGGVNQDWTLIDSSRNPYNVANSTLYPNLSSAEDTFDRTDFLSNGFKQRSTGNAFNGSGATYIYAAFAEFPFKFALAR